MPVSHGTWRDRLAQLQLRYKVIFPDTSSSRAHDRRASSNESITCLGFLRLVSQFRSVASTSDHSPRLDKPLRAAKNDSMITLDTSPHLADTRGPKVLIPKGDEALVESTPRYACHRCGATSYRAIMSRGADGAMRASGRHACTGCRLEFDHVSEWAGTSSATELA